jgi:hypothetical protein
MSKICGSRGDILFNALSASRTRRFRACSRVERESLMRDTAALSGAMWKFPAVWWMSWVVSVCIPLRANFADGLRSRDLRRAAF